MKIRNIFAGYKRKAVIMLFDVMCFATIDLLYYFIASLPDSGMLPNGSRFFINSAILLVLLLAMRVVLKVYRSVWRYTNTAAYARLIIADGFSCFAAMALANALGSFSDIWSVALVASVNLIFTVSARITYRLLYKFNKKKGSDNDSHKIPVAIVGAGQIGALLAEELRHKRSNYKPVFFIDKDVTKAGGIVAGLKVYHESENIIDFIKTQNISEIFVAIGGLDNETSARIYDFYNKTSCKIKIYDTAVNGYYAGNSDSRRTIREFQIEDLLFRESFKADNDEIKNYYSDKTVLVTGGGGSIGSELCRQIAKCSPKKLVIIDIYENNAYEIQQELTRRYGGSLDLAVEIASVRDRERLDCIFGYYKPDVVFHDQVYRERLLRRCDQVPELGRGYQKDICPR